MLATTGPRKHVHLHSVATADAPIAFHTIHGYRRAVRVLGDGPPLLFIHGIGDNSETWLDVLGHFAKRYTVIAPDLLGHGESEKPRADYSAGGYANGMRDLLTVLGYDRVTIVGHSMGGGIAMQIAYQFPELVERVVLVSAGGVGREVHPLLRLASAPGFSPLLRILTLPGVSAALDATRNHIKHHPLLRTVGASILHDAADVMRVLADQSDAVGHRAFIRILRAGVDWRGQVITMLDRAYLCGHLPVFIVWGARDAIVPAKHARLAHAALPGSRLDIFPEAGHFPFRDDPLRFVAVVEEFLRTTPPSEFDPRLWRQTLTDGFSPSSVFGDVQRGAVIDAMAAAERGAT